MRWRRIITIVLAFWLWYYAPLFAEPPVHIVNRYRLGMAPLYTTFAVYIEQHELNRELCIWWGKTEWDKNLWDKSCRQLDGLATKRTYHYPPSNRRILREPGEWTIEAELIRSDKTFRDRTTIIVSGGF